MKKQIHQRCGKTGKEKFTLRIVKIIKDQKEGHYYRCAHCHYYHMSLTGTWRRKNK